MTEQAQGEQPTLVTPDFSTAQDAVEPGIYSVRIVDSKFETWKGKDGKKDTTVVAWTMETFNESEPKNNGRKIFYRTPIEGSMANRLKSFFKAAMHEDIAGAFDRTMLHGRELEVTIGQQKNDPQYTEVKAVKAILN